MTSFVTGATGFIGQRLLIGLEVKGGGVRILSRRANPDYETVVCDLQFETISANELDGISTVFHLSGFTHDFREAKNVEYIYNQVNVDATVRLARLAVTTGVKKFVFVSSVKAGGYNEEDEESQPEGVYGQTKREAELKLLDIGRQSEMHVSILRPALVYGTGAKGNLALMLRGVEQGWFPPLPDTGNRRSMIHVDDLVRALLLIAEDDRANGEIFIATDGVAHSSRQIYEATCLAVGKSPPNWNVPRFIFRGISLLSPRLRYKVDKLLGEEYYSSKKLEGLGFRAEKSLKDLDKSDYL